MSCRIAADILAPVITLVEALNFRCLRDISRPMGPFHVLVGPNASGKTTFLDVVRFLGDLVSGGIEKAVFERTSNFQDLTWRRDGEYFELAIEAQIPELVRRTLRNPEFALIRYEISLGLDPSSQDIRFRSETVLLKTAAAQSLVDGRVALFPDQRSPPASILHGTGGRGTRAVINKQGDGTHTFQSEANSASGEPWSTDFKLGGYQSALASLPADFTKFAATSWLKWLLTGGTQCLMINSLLLRKASAPGQGRNFRADGSNLPWAVHDLERKAPDDLRAWVAHLATALPDLETVRTVERADDKHRYLMLGYRGGLEVPSWMVSDGTLRLMALTLPAYLPDVSGIFLIEEPENGIHPRAIETMFQSLSSVYDAQVLLATHSPVILGLVELDQLLCFAKTPDGATDIVLGSEHPMLKEWRREVSLSVLFAAGVLGYGE